MSGVYAGIGSRETPANVLAQMSMLAFDLAEAGWTLRSGAAPGADAAFESGLLPHHPREIYLPWKGFASHPSTLCKPSEAAYAMAAQVHPAWERCSRGARGLHARNCHQVLGPDLATPVDMVVCWTEGGKGQGGTGQALRLAKAHNIVVFDFGNGMSVVEDLREYVHELRLEAGQRPG